MNRLNPTCCLLMALLVWQQCLGAFVHAGHHMASADVVEAAAPHHGDHHSAAADAPAPCEHHVAMTVTPDTTDHADEMANASNHTSSEHCCGSLFCKCPGMQVLTLTFEWHDCALPLPELLPMTATASFPTDARLTPLFRPPIPRA